MAKIKLPGGDINKAAENSLKPLENRVKDKLLINEFPQSYINKLWVAKILLNRATSNKAKSIPSPLDRDPAVGNTTITNQAEKDKVAKVKDNYPKPSNKKAREPQKTNIKNLIKIVNPNTHPPTVLVIQTIPTTLDINPETSWASVKSMGRNNPFMVYTGAEDTVSFDISWYATQKNREDVINKCRLLESWSKADGYHASPPVLHILWGTSGIFDEQEFVLTAATYKLSNFQNAYKEGDKIVDLKLLPNTASQSLTFKRVTKNNIPHELILSTEKAKVTNGIIMEKANEQ